MLKTVALKVLITPGSDVECDNDAGLCAYLAAEAGQMLCRLWGENLVINFDRRVLRAAACRQAQRAHENQAADVPEVRGAVEELKRWFRGAESLPVIDAADTLRQKRELLGLTRVQLAALAGVADSTIRNIETRRHRPSTWTLHRLANALTQALQTSHGRLIHGSQQTGDDSQE